MKLTDAFRIEAVTRLDAAHPAIVPVKGLELTKPSLENIQKARHSFSWQCAIGERCDFRAIQRDFLKTNLNVPEKSEDFVPASALNNPLGHHSRQAFLSESK